MMQDMSQLCLFAGLRRSGETPARMLPDEANRLSAYLRGAEEARGLILSLGMSCPATLSAVLPKYSPPAVAKAKVAGPSAPGATAATILIDSDDENDECVDVELGGSRASSTEIGDSSSVTAPASILTDTIIPLDCDDSEEAVELEAALLPSQHDTLSDVAAVETIEHMPCVGNVLVPQVPGSASSVPRVARFGRIMISTITTGGAVAQIPLCSALSMLRANYSLSADRALRIMNASKQQLTVLHDVSDDFVTEGAFVAVRMDTGVEVGRVARIGTVKVRGAGFLQCSSPVSLRDHPAGMFLWFQWLDRIPFDLMTGENLILSAGASKPLASDLLYQYHDEFYNDGGELLA